MKNIKYFIQFLLIIISFVIFKLLGVKFSSNLSGKIFEKIGPFFRSKRIIQSNIKRAFPNANLDWISPNLQFFDGVKIRSKKQNK